LQQWHWKGFFIESKWKENNKARNVDTNGCRQIPHENISSFLYVDHLCLKHMIFVCKMYVPMKNDFRTISITKRWDGKFVIQYWIF
jgi:hypothetical protein